MRSSFATAVVLVGLAVAGCQDGRGDLNPPAAVDLDALAAQFNIEIYECMVERGVPATFTDGSVFVPDSAAGGGAHTITSACTDGLLAETRFAPFAETP